MNLAHKSRKIIITGQSGTGKSTYYTQFILNAWRTLYECVFVFDHQGEFSARTGTKASVTEQDLVQDYAKTGFVAFDPSTLFPGDTSSAWTFFCEWVFERAKAAPNKPKLIAVDELQLFSSTGQVDWELSCVIETGRKYGLDFLAISQQLNLIHNRLRNQATEIVTFRHVDRLILDALEQLGFDVDAVTRLVDGQFICRDMLHSQSQQGSINLTCVSGKGQQTNKSQSESGSDGSELEESEENETE